MPALLALQMKKRKLCHNSAWTSGVDLFDAMSRPSFFGVFS